MNTRVHCPARAQVYKYWSDAKSRARTVSILHGYAAIIAVTDGWEVIFGDDLDDVLERACGAKLEAEFNEHGVQTL